ncbi:axial regulator YABBY 5-like protein [Tanacetum coccineum]
MGVYARNITVMPADNQKNKRMPTQQALGEEIQRMKANNQDISHREAFSTAAKNMNHIAGHVRQMDGVLSQLTSTRNAKGINSEVTNVSSNVKNEKYEKRKATELGKLWLLGLQIKDANTLATLNVIRLISKPTRACICSRKEC